MTTIAPTKTLAGSQGYGITEGTGGTNGLPDYHKQNVDAAWLVLQKQNDDVLEEVELQQPPISCHCSPRNVAVVVDIRLERDEDRTPKCFKLAQKIKQKLDIMLKRRFPGESHFPSSTQLILHATISVASEGSAFKRIVFGPLVYTGTRTGLAQVVIVWCLQDVKTGCILMGRRMVQTSSLKYGLENVVDWKGGQHAVMRMTEEIIHDISKEVWEKIQVAPA